MKFMRNLRKKQEILTQNVWVFRIIHQKTLLFNARGIAIARTACYAFSMKGGDNRKADNSCCARLGQVSKTDC